MPEHIGHLVWPCIAKGPAVSPSSSGLWKPNSPAIDARGFALCGRLRSEAADGAIKLS